MKREYYYTIEVVASGVMGLLAIALIWVSLTTAKGDFVSTTMGFLSLLLALYLVVSAIRRKELTFGLDVRLSILMAVFLILSFLFLRQLVSPELAAVDVLKGLILLLLWGYWTFVARVKRRDARKEQQGGESEPAGVGEIRGGRP